MNFTPEELVQQMKNNPDLGIQQGATSLRPIPEGKIAKSDRVKAREVHLDTPTKRHALIRMPYQQNLSVNHYKFGYFTKPEVVEWKNDLVAEIQVCHVKDWRGPLKVTVSGTFKNLRSCPDVHNTLKIICDSVQAATGLNDKFYSTETTAPVINSKVEPYLDIRIEEI